MVELDLSNGRLKNFNPDDIPNNVTNLNLSNNKLEFIPAWVFLIKTLETLYLSVNQIQVIPPEIVQLTLLEKLDLYKNEIQVIPPEIGQLSSLKKFYISHNEIQEIPLEIGQCESLVTFRISENPIENPKSLEQLKYDYKQYQEAISVNQALIPYVDKDSISVVTSYISPYKFK